MLLCLWLQTHLTFSSLTFCSFSASKLSLILFMLASFSPITFLAIYKTVNDWIRQTLIFNTPSFTKNKLPLYGLPLLQTRTHILFPMLHDYWRYDRHWADTIKNLFPLIFTIGLTFALFCSINASLIPQQSKFYDCLLLMVRLSVSRLCRGTQRQFSEKYLFGRRFEI